MTTSSKTAKMSRQHYQLIAEVVAKLKSLGDNQLYVADMFAEALKDTNPNFDKARFLKACGVSDE